MYRQVRRQRPSRVSSSSCPCLHSLYESPRRKCRGPKPPPRDVARQRRRHTSAPSAASISPRAPEPPEPPEPPVEEHPPPATESPGFESEPLSMAPVSGSCPT